MLRLVFLFVVLSLPASVSASPVKTVLQNAEQRGKATFSYLGLPIYDARLYTSGGAPLDWQEDFALELRYKRRLSQNDLVQSTLREMARMGEEIPVADQLANCFSDVGRGDTYLAVTDGPNRIRFWRNGRAACTLSYPLIKQRFMNIFLGQNTRSARFTRRLKGQ